MRTTRRLGLRMTMGLPVCLGACLALQLLAKDSTVLNSKTQILVDDLLIERMDNVMRTLNNPNRAVENPVLKPDQDWEGSLILQPGTVLYDEEEHIFKMWYNSLPTASKPDIEEFICYATSKDGIHWTRPQLNLVEFKGSKKNNIVLKWCS